MEIKLTYVKSNIKFVKPINWILISAIVSLFKNSMNKKWLYKIVLHSVKNNLKCWK